MNNPRTDSRPQSVKHKQEQNARVAKQVSGERGPNNKNKLNSDVTSQYQNGKVELPKDQRKEMLRENHDKTKNKK